ncbi:MAG: nuclear transport factor 2 family protein [Acidimicrobiales bacterium]
MIDPIVVDRIRAALASGDVDDFAVLLAPDVTWGAPGSENPPCRSDRDVLRWYRRALDRGVRGTVTEVTPAEAGVLVGLMVTGSPTAEDLGQVERWQVLAVSDGRVTDIRGYEDRAAAVAALDRAAVGGSPPSPPPG